MYQSTIVLGNVGKTPELRYTQGGIAVCDFSVAVNKKRRKRNDADTEDQTYEVTTWFRVTCWRALAENVAKYVNKGDQIFVTGEVEASAWINKNEEAQGQLELTADQVRFLGSKKPLKGSASSDHTDDEIQDDF